ncbi:MULTISPECIES: flagellar motor protein MotB [Heyndrickxia]|jgi:chemotaxis protein MotB|uniref:Flagellar motor protein MotB n=1 Tax=Heyndrickxia oleronia TaxID=38875 RepID=A0A8E2LE74_9BACI|nr:flagellar motor protein MotB [Heyndrickxia oleronia]NYV63877.1 flagellar motor protein MotB [Bacillus sp. Gen3]OJH19650.1 flagellar motor protein MotB [Bacillus obstructivus]MBU5212704.1 flagellar motor protein MotB [Heyndrickxia oleronia]MCI1592924.1 flagellar motor protein MotB [Heyndrickxia oleronia]MCI1613821.1 flagellar motor protein MotB [Heyndrickxia oleronia]
MSKRRKKGHEDEHVDESWLLPYADLLTLLLALFIVLFASSTVNAQKFQQLSKVFNGIFASGEGVMEYSKPQPADEYYSGKIKADQNKEKENKSESTEEKDKEQELKDHLQKLKLEDHEELVQVQEKVNAYIQTNHLNGKFATSLTTEGLLLTIRDNVLFESGKADISENNLKTARELSDLLVMDPPRNIIISGHTDNVPIHNSNFSSNFELSVMRALNFMKIILENNQLNPRNFSVKGFGEYKPIASNDTSEGKAKNRRVEVLIQPRVLPSDSN